jgi:signal transduction histidine kinase
MKNQSQQIPPRSTLSAAVNTISLYQLVNKLQASLLPQATGKNSFIINNVDKTVSVHAEENALSFVIGSLLSNAVFSSSDCCIRIETAFTGDQLQIRIRNSSALAPNSYSHVPGNFVDAARQLGGNIGLEKDGTRAVTLVLSLLKNSA